MNTKSFNKCIYLFLLLFMSLNMFCGKKASNPTSFHIEDYPVAPNNIKAAIGDGVIVLTWLHLNVETIQNYKIYRQDSTGQTFRNIGMTDQLSYTDKNLQNHREYQYKVSAVGKNGLEGQKSQIVSAVPSIFGVTINSDQEFTNSRSVTLSFTAPAITSFIKVSNDSLLANAQWESFVGLRNWTLTQNDGNKIVFVKFRDAEDRQTIELYSDNIILDTEAIIKQLTEDSDGRVLTAGDTIHFNVVTEEPAGSAWVDLGGIQSGIKLFDDGTNGDLLADDGVYETNFRISTGMQVEGAFVLGHFIDRVGNVARLEASSRVTIRRSPVRINLIQVAPVNSSSTALNLFWTTNTDEDFANYRIFRSTNSGVDTESTLVTILQDQSTVNYTDTDLEPNTTHYYRVYVFDTTGLFSGSNEVSGTTNPNEPPMPVSLSISSSLTALNLFWTTNTDEDFANHRIFRSTNSGVDTESTLVTILPDQSTVSYTDTDLEPNTTYYYRVYVFDTTGLFSGSNEVSGTTNPNEPPKPVSLSIPVQTDSLTLRLSWSQSDEEDFASYRLYRSEFSPVDTTNAFVILNDDRTLTQYDDVSVKRSVEYFYRVFVFDKLGLSAGSNEVSGRISN